MNPKVLNGILMAGSIIILAVLIYFSFDVWQASVHVYASGCETEGGRTLPAEVCKYIVHYRYQQGD